MNKNESIYLSIAEDIEWLRDEWWLGSSAGPREDRLRRGSTTLRLLLVDQLAIKAWRHYGFDGQPIVHGPDLMAFASRREIPIPHIFSLVVGGGRVNNVDTAMLGMYRKDNPDTGAKAMDDVGFAVVVTNVARRVRQVPHPSDLDPIIERAWPINAYLDAPSAVFDGEIFARREIIQYFANFAGGAHLDKSTRSNRAKRKRYELISQLDGRINSYDKDGLHFELQSIGQAVGRSKDFHSLAAAIKGQVTK